ncbi:hypothetical protein AB1Y20_012429 [Prymnesium parvum]|uniref:Nucleotide-diphospho-sugar transferase domain-containing protein n=1 Tax=Prymnesium parvum TaxID=97485 RepID=A0AB34IKU2_PRYPA
MPSDFCSASRCVEWWPAAHSSLCAFTVAVGAAASLRVAVEHNANWAVAHAASFTLFGARLGAAGPCANWEKPLAAARLLRRGACGWALFVDADALVSRVEAPPVPLLRQMAREAAPAAPLLFAACNSPLGSRLECDGLCCGRRGNCSVRLREEGPASPFPCLINSGVFFVRNTPRAHALLREWYAHHADKETHDGDPFYEQESLNMLKEKWPDLIEVVGGQVMNTHSSFHRRLLDTADPHVAYDIALRTSTGYEPSIRDDSRLNRSLYQQLAWSAYGAPLGSARLRERLHEELGECVDDPEAFICHAFARPIEIKVRLAEHVAASRRARLLRLLHAANEEYRTLDEVERAQQAYNLIRKEHRPV